MKKEILFLTLVMLSSCKVSDLVKENNSIVSRVESESKKTNELIENNFEELKQVLSDPEISKINLCQYNDFYSGVIKAEKVTTINNDWKQIELTKVIRSGNINIEVNSKGYLNTNSPDQIYVIKNEVKNTLQNIAQLDSRSYSFEKKIVDSLINNKLGPSQRTDIYTQKEVDIMLANGNYCFDGFVFKSKQFDYLDLEKGSFRGVIFDGCRLDDAIVRRTAYNNTEFDFEQTQIKNSSQIKNLDINYWKFNKGGIINSEIRDSEFKNCIFNETGFNNVVFKNVKFKNYNDGYMNDFYSLNSRFEGCRFDSTLFLSCVTWANTFSGCVFNGCEIKWTALLPYGYGGTPTKMEYCTFLGGRFFSGDQSNIEIFHVGAWSEFYGVEFSLINWRNAKVKGWFKENCFFSAGSNFEGLDWTSSIFEDTKFNNTNSTVTFNIKNCNFSGCEFRPGVEFNNCKFTGVSFPPTASLQNAGVKFYNCQGAPYDN